MTKDEAILLLFLETCAVDHGGLVRESAMNQGDFAIARRWTETGYVRLERVRAADREPSDHASRNYIVSLSDEAFADAHRLRRERAVRLNKTRTRLTVAEFEARETQS